MTVLSAYINLNNLVYGKSLVSGANSASEMTYIVSSGALNSTHSLTSGANPSPQNHPRTPLDSLLPWKVF